MSDKRWKRPDSVPFPKVWRRFKGKKPLADGVIPEFWIQDLSEDLLEEVVDHMVKFFLRDEPICKAISFLQDERSVREFQDLWRGLGRTLKVSLVALTQEQGAAKPTVVGANMLTIHYKGDTHDNTQYGVAMKKILDLLDVVSGKVDMFETYSVDEYLSGVGLSVEKRYSGQGIGEQLLLARRDLGLALGLKLTVTVFSSMQARTVAARAGFHTVLTVPFSEYMVDGEVVFKNIQEQSGISDMKLMAWRIQ